MCNDSDNIAPGTYAQGGLVDDEDANLEEERSLEEPDQSHSYGSERDEPMANVHKRGNEIEHDNMLPSEYNLYDDGHSMAMAEAVRERRARMEKTQPANNGPVNYADGGAIHDGQMMGVDEDDDEKLAEGYSDNRDEKYDNFLSQDAEGSLHVDRPYDMEDQDGYDSLTSEYNNKKKSRMDAIMNPSKLSRYNR